MSKSKHKYYRKVLSIRRFEYVISDNLKSPGVIVVYCTTDEETSRTVRTHLLGTAVYVGGVRFKGIEARHPNKLVSINKSNPMSSKYIVEHADWFQQDIKDALSQASIEYVLGTPRLSKNLVGEVRRWGHTQGSVYCKTLDKCFDVEACNIKGAKTWYPETSCMYLKEGQTVTFDLWSNGRYLSACNVRGGHFDAVKWESLDQDKLAFKCDDEGNPITGLFE